MFFFLLWPLFARAPRHWFLENFLLSAPGVQSVFFFVALRWAPRPFGGARAKKKNTQGVFFFLLRPRGKAGEGEAPCRHGASQGVFFLLRPRGRAREGEAPLGAARGHSKKKHHPGVFFCSGPGERQGKEKPRWAPARGHSKKKHQRGCSFPCLSPGPEQKKKTHPGWCFFFALAPCRAQRGFSFPCLSPGPQQKKTPWVVFFFLLWPRAGTGLLLPLPFPGAGAKKKHLGGVFFFALAPCRRPTGLLLPLPFAGAAAKKKHPGWCFFLLWPRAGTGLLLPLPFPGDGAKKKHLGGVFFCYGPVPAPNGASPSLAFRRGRSKKKTPWVVFFFLLWPRAGTGLLLPLPFPGAGAKQNTLGGVFFFCCGPARTLTHSLRAWVAMPPPRRGGVCFFCCGAGPDRGGVFFFAVAPPGRSLTHCGLGRFRQGPGGVFFLLRPRRVFLDNNKKCLGYYIGSKKTRRGHSKKKNTTS